jgi:hypothetical protein
MRQLPLYQCHKKVWALKIAAIETVEHGCICSNPNLPRADCDSCGSAEHRQSLEGAEITPADPGFAPFRVTVGYVEKHKPQVGGYFVQYADGYKSFSPAQVFEEGYTLIS